MHPRILASIAVLALATFGCRGGAKPEPSKPPPTPIPPLKYVERVLGGADADAALPTIIAIHGLSDRPESFVHLFEGFDRPARLILPRGPGDYAGGAMWFTSRVRDRDPEALARGMRDAANAVLALIDRLEKDGKVLGKPIVTGFSQGGMVTLALAVEHPDRLGYALPVGGVLPPPLWPTTQAKRPGVPIRALHGKADQVVPFAPADQGIRALADRGLDARMIPFDRVGHAIPPPVRDTLFRMLADALERTAKARTKTATVAP